uniref:hypothetical protein n=1 Tax=Candidatus Enterovibrio escicola TaxID=1927127 RepID=UPI001237C49C|nr:hypothetical protein [Candidatus Enterovibrio escacola]
MEQELADKGVTLITGVKKYETQSDETGLFAPVDGISKSLTDELKSEINRNFASNFTAVALAYNNN